MLKLPMDRNSIFRPHQSINQLNLLLAGMPRYMDILKNHVRALKQQLIDHIGNRLFIARDWMRGKDHRIAGTDGNPFVIILRHTA